MIKLFIFTFRTSVVAASLTLLNPGYAIAGNGNTSNNIGSNQQPALCDCSNCSAEHCPRPSDHDHNDEIDVLSWSWGQSISGANAGKVSLTAADLSRFFSKNNKTIPAPDLKNASSRLVVMIKKQRFGKRFKVCSKNLCLEGIRRKRI